MPLESLQTLQDLEITGTEGSQQGETQCETVENDEQQPGQPFQPDLTSAPHQASQAHSFQQPHISPFYPPLSNSFGFDSDSTIPIPIPIDPGLLDARFDRPAVPGPGGGGVPGFHQDPWAAQPATSVNMDSFMVSPTSMPQYNNASMPFVPGMSSFEPMVSTTWSVDGSLTSTSPSTSRAPTTSSSLSVLSASTPASSQSPGSPRKVSTSMIHPPAASKESMPIRLGKQVDSRAEDQPNKKRRQASGPNAPPKTSAEKSRQRNNSAPGFTAAAQVPIAPAISAVAATSDDQKNNNNNKDSSTSKHQKKSSTATTATTSSFAPGLSQPGASSQPTTFPAQQQQGQAQPQPDPRARNREAANRCRAKSKVAVAELEATERAMGAEHQELTRTARSLREEVLSLKNMLLLHGNCDDDLIQRYLANSARMVGSGAMGPVAAPVGTTTPGGGVASMPQPALGGGSSGSSHAMLSASPPGMMPGVLPTSSAPGAGMAVTGRGHHYQKGGGARKR